MRTGAGGGGTARARDRSDAARRRGFLRRLSWHESCYAGAREFLIRSWMMKSRLFGAALSLVFAAGCGDEGGASPDSGDYFRSDSSSLKRGWDGTMPAFQAAHMDEAAAKANPFFPGRVAHGYLILAFAAGLFVDPAPGPLLANYGLDNLRFLKPVSPDDSIRVRLTVKQKSPARKPSRSWAMVRAVNSDIKTRSG